MKYLSQSMLSNLISLPFVPITLDSAYHEISFLLSYTTNIRHVISIEIFSEKTLISKIYLKSVNLHVKVHGELTCKYMYRYHIHSSFVKGKVWSGKRDKSNKIDLLLFYFFRFS